MFSAWLNTLLKGLQMIWNKKPESKQNIWNIFSEAVVNLVYIYF